MRFHAVSSIEFEVDVEFDGGLEQEMGAKVADALHAAGCAHAGAALEILRWHGIPADLAYRGQNVGKGPLG